MASIEHASRARVEQIAQDARGIAKQPDALRYDLHQTVDVAEREIRRRGEAL
jgi:hypothetical protein